MQEKWPYSIESKSVYNLLPGERTPEPSLKQRNSPISPATPHTPRSVRKITKKVIGESSTSPQRKYAKKLSSTVERLLVTNALMRQDLLYLKEALAAKPIKNKRRLVGPGVFSLENLNRMRQDQDQKEEQQSNRRKQPNTSQQGMGEG
jgi:hypothetical protein